MSTHSIFGLIDPRDNRIFHVGMLNSEVSLNEHLADVVAEAIDGNPSPTEERVRAILAADFEAPHAVILQVNAGEADLANWTRVLRQAGNALTNGAE